MVFVNVTDGWQYKVACVICITSGLQNALFRSCLHDRKEAQKCHLCTRSPVWIFGTLGLCRWSKCFLTCFLYGTLLWWSLCCSLISRPSAIPKLWPSLRRAGEPWRYCMISYDDARLLRGKGAIHQELYSLMFLFMSGKCWHNFW